MTAAPERADARANRARLLCAAVDLFAEQGPSAEIRDVAERAGLSVGAVYRHFPSKEDLVAAILGQLQLEFQQVVEEALTTEDTIAALRALCSASIELALRRSGLFKTLLDAGAWCSRPPDIEERKRVLLGWLRGFIERGIADGSFRPDVDPPVAARVLAGAFQPWSLADLAAERSVDEIVDHFVALFVHGVQAGTRGAAHPA